MKAPHATRWALLVLMAASLVALAPAAAAADTATPAGHHALAHPPIPEPVKIGNAPGGGPVGPADIDFVQKVRLAGMWELPAGQLAATKGVNPRVREIGTMIASQHGELDQLAIDAAKKTGVQLPSQPNADQLFWLKEMEDAEGAEFDQVFVDRLRAAHGKIFPIIGEIRSGTRNDVIRDLAQATNAFVMNHLSLLESTGLVDWTRLPLPPEPFNGVTASQSFVRSGVDPIIIWLVLGAAVIAGVSTTIRVVRPR